MFDDFRSKKVILLSHCLLNQNSISDGTSDFPSQFKEVIEFLMTNEVGIIQLPCPELLCLGLARRDINGAQNTLLDENSRIRKLMSTRENRQILKYKAEEIIGQILEYRKYDFIVLGLIGVDRSPSCGIETTSQNGAEEPGKGVFMDILSKTLAKNGIPMKMIGTRTGEKKTSLEKVKQLLQG